MVGSGAEMVSRRVEVCCSSDDDIDGLLLFFPRIQMIDG
jgi:hypothetical protein